MPELKDLLAVFTTLVAAFAGAWAAFAFEGRNKKREEERRNVGAGNRAIYTVYSQWNVLEQFRKEVLEPYRGRDEAWLNLAAQPAAPTATDRFQVAELQFLIEESQATVFATLLLEEQRFDLAMSLIRSRSDLVLNEVFPKMAAARLGIGQAVDQRQVEEALGVDVCHKLRELTAAIYKNVDEDLTSLRGAYDLLRISMKKIYPKRKFLEIVFEPKPEEKGGNGRTQ